jgi:hypothetical protein
VLTAALSSTLEKKATQGGIGVARGGAGGLNQGAKGLQAWWQGEFGNSGGMEVNCSDELFSVVVVVANREKRRRR